ncbi:MAG: hypothetical protein GY721_05885 [Deltaproteobacteria bacterium]|nr:hypothetical protein [Deltaproteobacteria bacterium]
MDAITSYKNASPTNITSAIKAAVAEFTEWAQAADDTDYRDVKCIRRSTRA